MEYTSKELTIKDLIELIESKKINLRPPYQRNFIWTPKDQKLLIDSIHKEYPLPSFFILKKNNGNYEMVDGQQRAFTIQKYYNGEFYDSQKKYYKDTDQNKFLNYRLIIIEIKEENFICGESIEEFFSLVNKRGVHLNPAEVNQAQFHDSDFLQLVNEIMEYQPLIDLDIFTDKTKVRMNDRSLIEELVAYLLRGITDKRKAVDDLFETQINDDDKKKTYKRCVKIIDTIAELNKFNPINETRYKQRNDFYTLFCFIEQHQTEELSTLKRMYQVLVYISNNEYISPSNEDCEPFKRYALNCVSQSNSKNARENRLLFFNELLCNTRKEGNDTINDILEYLESKNQNIDLVEIGQYWLMNCVL